MTRNFAEEAKIVKNNVLELLETIPATRNSDRLLLATYWQRFDNIRFNEAFVHEFVSNSTSAESITRARRAIQKAGLYPPTEEDVINKRRGRQQEAQQHFATER